MTANPSRRKRRILVPIDGSPLSESILPFVASLGPAEVTLLCVVETSLLGGDRADAKETGAAEGNLRWIGQRLRERLGADVAVVVRHGRPADEVLAAAVEIGADAIAMTTHGRSGFDQLVLGSVAARVVRASPVPVLTLRAERPLQDLSPRPDLLSRVLVAHDGSDLAGKVVDVVAAFARGGPPATAVLYGVVETLEAPSARFLADPEGKDLAARYLKMQGDELRRLLEKEAERARGLGLETGVEVEIGRPIDRILAREASLPATLVAVATHGRSGIAKWVLGSVTEKLLHSAKGPMLICK
jgi:nucleotide-binding universal stress UspA family protein